MCLYHKLHMTCITCLVDCLGGRMIVISKEVLPGMRNRGVSQVCGSLATPGKAGRISPEELGS